MMASKFDNKKQNKVNSGIKTAVALQYDPDLDDAPRVIAGGRGEIATQIIALAQQSQIPIQEDELLTKALLEVELDQVIPPELYTVVAELLAFVYRLKQKKNLIS